MTDQELFTNAWLGLKAQDWQKSENMARGKCMYRGPEGRKCAIGHNILDEEYHPDMDGSPDGEGSGIDCGNDRIIEWRCKHKLGPNRTSFLQALQSAHDCATNEQTMRTRLCKVAEDFGLEVQE